MNSDPQNGASPPLKFFKSLVKMESRLVGEWMTARSGVFVVTCVRPSPKAKWECKLYVIMAGKHTHPLASIGLPSRKSARRAIHAAESAAMSYVIAAKRSIR